MHHYKDIYHVILQATLTRTFEFQVSNVSGPSYQFNSLIYKLYIQNILAFSFELGFSLHLRTSKESFRQDY